MKPIDMLQEKIAYQERTIDVLNDALTNQQKQITQLQQEMQLLTQLLQQLRQSGNDVGGDDGLSSGAHEIPPHY